MSQTDLTIDYKAVFNESGPLGRFCNPPARRNWPKGILGHFNVDGGRKLCPPSTPIGLPRACKTYASFRWMQNMCITGKESRREQLFPFHHEGDDHIAGAERIHRGRVLLSSDQVLPLAFIAAGRKA